MHTDTPTPPPLWLQIVLAVVVFGGMGCVFALELTK